MTRLVRIGEVAQLLGLSVSRVRQLADADVLPFERTTGGHRLFDIDAVQAMLVTLPPVGRPVRSSTAIASSPRLSRELPLSGLQEHLVWRDVATELALKSTEAPTHIMEYAFEEMLNNAIEHSHGTAARMTWWRTPSMLAFEVSDDGIGALESVRKHFDLPDELSAIQELSKGKRTTAPSAHSGQGIFFVSKAVDRFSITCNGWRWIVDNQIEDQTVEVATDTVGTSVQCRIDPSSHRTLEQVFREFSTDQEFDRTRPSVKLVSYGTTLISRSQARMLLEGLDRFSEVDLDFAGVDSVGQGFVDEVFRVWAEANPETRIEPINMGPAVEFMVRRGLSGADL